VDSGTGRASRRLVGQMSRFQGYIPLWKPRLGRDSPEGGANLKCSPEGVTRESVIGLNSMDPANVMAVVNSGLVKKFMVPGFPSFRALPINPTHSKTDTGNCG